MLTFKFYIKLFLYIFILRFDDIFKNFEDFLMKDIAMFVVF